MAVVFLACPSYGGIEPETVVSLMRASKEHQVLFRLRRPGSLLAREFNALWCEALNCRKAAGITHFAMIHSDIQAEEFWLDELLKVQDFHGADIVSAVIPIKDTRGLTSTALQNKQNGDITRLTLKQVHALKKPTFSAKDLACTPSERMVVNTGLWVCDFTHPWVEKVHFGIMDDIRQNKDGIWEPVGLSEDWFFSGMCDDLGVKIMATLAVKVSHLGRYDFSNDHPWGEDFDTEPNQ